MKEAKVSSHYDGDTLEIKTKIGFEKIRLAYIDTPERGQPYYLQAKKRLTELLPLNSVINYKVLKKDIYHRTLAEIYHNNQFINELMIAEGLALVYPFMHNPYKMKMLGSQTLAKEQKVNIWSQLNFITPWDYRKQNKELDYD